MDKITIERETLQAALDDLIRLAGLSADKAPWRRISALRAALAAQPAETQPVAKVASKHGDPERFGEREIRVLADLRKIPYGTKLYAAQPAPAAVPPGYVLVPIEPTPEMVAAYLSANTEYWRLVDGFPPKIGVWRNGTPSQATAESYRAMIAAAKRVAP